MQTPIDESTSEKPILSVIMPTYNRHEILHKVLDALNQQVNVGFDAFEVIVVDDCSTDRTKETLAAFTPEALFAFRYHTLETNGGPARARNVALEMVKGEIVLIIGDDIVPEPDLLQQHLAWHLKHPSHTDAVLGYITWPAQMHVTPFMRWLETGGKQYFFNYPQLCEDEPVDPIFFYTCNVSVKRQLIERAGGFDESFPYASHEDLEFGYRLQAVGMRLYYRRSAVGYHWHPLSLKGVARRMYLMGHSSILFWQKAPDRASLIRRSIRVVIREIMGYVPVLSIVRLLISNDVDHDDKTRPVSWRLLLALCFWRGMYDGCHGVLPQLFVREMKL